MNIRRAPPRDRSDYQEHEAEYFARHARPADQEADGEFKPGDRQWRQEQMNALDADYRAWRQDRNRKFGETFDQWRASRPARSHAAGSRTLPPSEGTEPGQPNSAPPGASGKNK
ncbi:MAG TPA: hypothetical protein VEX14_17940 [Burkholderiaceae bacterium]|nr:hypothetical protein [Burkholderiaceae bacterium]